MKYFSFEKNRKASQKSFEKRMMDIGRIPNLITGGALALYLFYFSGLANQTIGLRNIIYFFIFVVLIVSFSQFIIAPRTNHFITGKLSKHLETVNQDKETQTELENKLFILKKNKDSDFNEIKETEDKIKDIKNDRTDLVKQLLKCPVKISIQVVIVFALSMIIFTFLLIYFIKIDRLTFIFVLAAYISGLYDAGIFSYSYAKKLCTEYTIKLTEMGLDSDTIKKDKFYGLNFTTTTLIFIILSYFITNIVEIMFIVMESQRNITTINPFINMVFLIMINLGITITLATVIYKQVTQASYNLNSTIENFLRGNLQEDLSMPVDMGSEMSYNLHLVNEIISYLKDLSSKANLASIGIQQQISELAITAEEVAKTSSNMSYIIDNSNNTMSKNVKTQLEEISTHIKSVSLTANETKNHVDDGFTLLQNDVSKIEEITQANMDTISGIKVLSDKIDSMWESIKKIDSLAEKTRIIAFNAELEATAAGEGGENFHIVANEIRRLADTITDSVFEIKEKIKSIQHSSDNLIITSEAGTQQIREGSQFFINLEEKFKELKLKSDITAEYASEIQNIISTQDTSFIQISSTLTQINQGYKEFTNSTTTLTDSAEVLKDIAHKLHDIYKNKSEEA